MPKNKFLKDVILCLKKHEIECMPKGAPNPKTGDYYNYQLKAKNDIFHISKNCNVYKIKLDKSCNSDDVANAIIETVSMRYSQSNHDEAKQIIHELYDLKNEYNIKPSLIYGVVD